MVLFEDAKHLVLVRHLAQLIRMLTRGQTQQQTIEILLKPKEIELRGIGKQRTVIIVHIAINIIIGSKQSASRFQQLYL